MEVTEETTEAMEASEGLAEVWEATAETIVMR
jgi:hypothetical protein